jgi:glutathionylspermidine amidase/synthetase
VAAEPQCEESGNLDASCEEAAATPPWFGRANCETSEGLASPLMSDPRTPQPTPFGTLLGYAPGGVPAYSSDYETVDREALPDRSSFRSVLDDVNMGFKWQCVEFARRWMFINHGYVFEDIAMAYDIFRLKEVRLVKEDRALPLHSFRNGCPRRPAPGCLLIWNEGGEYETTGHVAVVTEVTDTYVRVAEQNVDHVIWPQGQDWARELPVTLGAAGNFWIGCTYDDASILGWVIQTQDATHSTPVEDTNPDLLKIISQETSTRVDAILDPADPANEAYVQMNGQRLATRDEHLGRYFLVSESARVELKRATNELHQLFLHATDHVLRTPDLLERFGFPTALLPRIYRSWENRRTHAITGRFDFAMAERGLKVYEYNVDSASCHMECGRVQGAWAKSHAVTLGRDPGAKLHDALAEAWRESHVTGVVHLFRDVVLEEVYHTRFMRAAIEAAGLECRVVNGVEGLGWDSQGRVVDEQGSRINWVWKTWAWETALDALRRDVESDESILQGGRPSRRLQPPTLVDALLHQEMMVFEPLWTLIPSNKAILPVLWSMMPNHPYLLESSFELTDSLRAKGYVAKPVVGRCGNNVTLFSADQEVLAQTGGGFEDRDQIYQELFKLPEIDGLCVQVCTFTADGHDAGMCLRCDPSLVIKSESDVLPARVIPDDQFLEIQARAAGG